MTKTVNIGGVVIGGGNKIAVQSMTNVPTHDIEKAVAQVNALAAAGCDIVRLAVPDEAAALAMEQIVQRTNVPLVRIFTLTTALP
jgi:(E)-4-hydroxy-3-methylbut-2-enyl-diphosphate synthase